MQLYHKSRGVIKLADSQECQSCAQLLTDWSAHWLFVYLQQKSVFVKPFRTACNLCFYLFMFPYPVCCCMSCSCMFIWPVSTSVFFSFLFPNQWYRPGRFWEVGDSSALDAGRSSEEEECCRWELHQGFGQSHGEMVLTRKYAQCCKTRVLLVVVPFSRWFYKLMRLHHLRFWIWLDVVFSWFKMPHSPQLRLQWLRLAYCTWPKYWQELVIVGYVGA